MPSTIARIILALCLCALVAPWSTGRAQNAALGFVVIVNRSNAQTTLPRAEVSRMFLKQVQRWGNGREVQPVDLAVSAAPREAFSRHVHTRSATSVASFWRQQIFAGRGVPPPEQATDAEVVRYVAAHAGGIGYVGPGSNISTVSAVNVTGL